MSKINVVALIEPISSSLSFVTQELLKFSDYFIDHEQTKHFQPSIL